MKLSNKIKEIFSDINWKIVGFLICVPFLGDLIDYMITGSEPYDDLGDYYETGLELCVLMSIGIYISHKRKDEERARNELKESEEKIRALTESAKDAILMIDDNENVSYWNPAAEKVFGYKNEEVIGENAWEHLAPERNRAIHSNKYKKMLETGDAELVGRTVELTAMRKGGVEFPMELSSSALKLKGKLHVIAIVRDITERKRAEDALKESEHKLRSLYETSPIGIVITDKTGAILNSNQAFCKIIGYTEDEITKLRFKDISHSGEIAKNLKYFNEMIEGKRDGYRMEKRYYHKDGSIIWGDLATAAIRDENGEFLYNYAFLEDITEKKVAQEKLLTSELRYKTLFNSASDAIFIVDMEGGFIDFNDVACERLGYSRKELSKMTVMDIDSPEFAARVPERIKEMEEKGQLIFESAHITKDNVRVPVEINGRMIEYDGKLAHLSVVRDITERKEAEKQLEKMDKLESLGILAGGIAHDFNNLLGAILGNLELAARGAKKDSKQYSYLLEGQAAVLRAKDLTQQLLTFSRGGAPIRTPESIEQIIKDTADFVIHGSKTKIVYSFDEDLDFAEVDAGQISQVISNLVINADQAMPREGIITITAVNYVVIHEISLTPTEIKPGRYIKVMISDEGIGIPTKHLKNIFDPYFSTKQTGSGLGLAIVYSITNAHYGDIFVDSTMGEGTTFTLYLPSVDRKEGLSTKEAAGYETGSGESILLIEDDKNVASTMESVLKELGYKPKVVFDGKAGVRFYKQRHKKGAPFDLVIMDLTIPGGMGGDEANTKILEIDPDAKTIATSGYSNDPILSEYKEHGYSGVLKKPVKFDDIGLTIYNIFKQGKER